MANLKFEHVSKIYDKGVKAVSDFCLEIKDKEFVVLVGPSGSGKTTVLRMVAGLEDITAGQIIADGKIINKLQPKDRDTAMVFQRYALFPHYTVYKNMSLGLRERGVSKEEADCRVREVAEFLGLSDYLCRKPNTLSGGQRQRVALGRAVVRKPKVFLLDEPLSNLDAKLRSEMRAEIIRLHERVKTTFIYVTHDQTEAMTMADRIVVMKEGVIQQTGTPTQIYNRPANKFVAGFIGAPQMNFYDCTICRESDGFTLDFAGVKARENFAAFSKIPQICIDEKREVTIGVRPHDIYYGVEQYGVSGNLIKHEARVGLIEELGGETLLYCDFDLNREYAADSSSAAVIKIKPGHSIKRGDIIKVSIDAGKLHFFDTESGERKEWL